MSTSAINRYHFLVNWGGTRVGFAEVSGLDIEIEAIDYREGSSPVDSTRKIPGLRKYNNITLKRNIMPGDNEFFDWINTKRIGEIERRNITISLLDAEHNPIINWKLRDCFPIHYYGPVLDARSGELAMETLVITHEGITVENA